MNPSPLPRESGPRPQPTARVRPLSSGTARVPSAEGGDLSKSTVARTCGSSAKRAVRQSVQGAGGSGAGTFGTARRGHPGRPQPTAGRSARRRRRSGPLAPADEPVGRVGGCEPPASGARVRWGLDGADRRKEVERRTDVVGIFPDEAAVARLATAVVAEAHDEWQIAERRYPSEGSTAKLYVTGQDEPATKEVLPANLAS